MSSIHVQTVHLLSEPDIVFLQSDSIILILTAVDKQVSSKTQSKAFSFLFVHFHSRNNWKCWISKTYNVTTFICSFFTAEILVKYGSTLERDGALHDRQLLCRVYEPAANKSSRQRVIEDATRASREPLPEGMVGSTHVWSRCR